MDGIRLHKYIVDCNLGRNFIFLISLKHSKKGESFKFEIFQNGNFILISHNRDYS